MGAAARQHLPNASVTLQRHPLGVPPSWCQHLVAGLPNLLSILASHLSVAHCAAMMQSSRVSSIKTRRSSSQHLLSRCEGDVLLRPPAYELRFLFNISKEALHTKQDSCGHRQALMATHATSHGSHTRGVAVACANLTAACVASCTLGMSARKRRQSSCWPRASACMGGGGGSSLRRAATDPVQQQEQQQQ